MTLAGTKPVLVFALVLLGACGKPKPGDACRAEQSSCAGPTAGLVCESGTLMAVACKGPDGCRAGEQGVQCDIRGDAPGDPCAGVANACAPGGKARVECLQRAIQVSPCRGPRGCYAEGEKVECDRSVAAEGDPCNFLTASDACSDDGKRALTCKGGKFVPLAVCRGPAGCRHFEGNLACDVTRGEAGDACMPKSVTCSVSGKERLTCVEGKLVVAERCTGPSGCHDSTGVEAECDRSVAPAGDACTPMSHACAEGAAAVLGCKDGKFAVERACAAGERCAPLGGGFVCRK